MGEPLPNLDLLRAIAVCLVLAQHLLRRMLVDKLGWIPTTSLGRFGVLLFFVHTCLVLLRSLERTRQTGSKLYLHFYVRRLFRVYPLSVLAVVAALALHLDSDVNGLPGLSHAAIPGKLTIVANFLLIQNWVSAKSIVNVLWSLPFELQMYVFLPLIFLWIRKDRRLTMLLVAWLISVGAAEIQLHHSAFGPLSLLRFVPNFLPGVIAFSIPRTNRIKAFAWPIFIGGLILIYTLNPTERMGWLLCLLLGLGIPQFQELSNPVLCYAVNRIATYSYGIYVSHQFAIWLSLSVMGAYSLWAKIPLLALLLFSIPVVLYHGLEKPAIRVGVNLANKISGQAPKKKEEVIFIAAEAQAMNAPVAS